MVRNQAAASEFATIIRPMALNTAASKGVRMLKCEVVPRAACIEIRTISPTIVSIIVQRILARRRLWPAS